MKVPENRSSPNKDFKKRIKAIRVRRLSAELGNLVDLKVKGIISAQEYKRRKKKLLGF